MNRITIIVLTFVVGLGVGYIIQNNLGGDHKGHGMDAGDSHVMHTVLSEVPEGSTAPTVTLEVLKDPKSGWNAKISTTGFSFAPEKASTNHVFGEGHAHIYVDGVKINRVYGEWYHLGVLAEGSHEIRAELSGNDHSTYAQDGVKIDSTVVIEVEAKKEVDRENAKTFDVAVSERKLSPGVITVTEGDSVIFNIVTDEGGEFHIAGYEIEKEMKTENSVEVSFVAELAGRYNLELHPAQGDSMGDGEQMEGHSNDEDIVIGALVVNPK
ncbi:MAG: hypothetical protein WD509_02065 [Candidatus Paceibacterota bacterium]